MKITPTFGLIPMIRTEFDMTPKQKELEIGPLAGQEGNGAKYFGPPEVGSMTFASYV